MAEAIDPNKLAAEFLNSNINRILDSVASGMKGTKNAIRRRLKGTYRSYLDRIIERHSKAKSFFVRTEPLPIYDFFVPPDLSSQQRHLDRPTAADLAAVAPAAIITGSGGCGKTMLMRHLLVSALKDQQKTPILLELRQLNTDGEEVRAALLRTLKSNGLDIDESYFELALTAGHFCLLLDGFDELELRFRKTVADQVRTIAENYPGNWIVLSSRPDSKLEGWQAFSQFSVAPFDLERATELVEKLPFDDPIKSKFVSDLRSELYNLNYALRGAPEEG